MKFNSLFLSMITLFITNGVLTCSAIGHGTAYVNNEGNIVVSTDLAVFGLDINSKGGHLIPIPPGDLTAPADPFSLFFSNSSTQIAYNGFRFMEFEEEVLSAKYAPPEGVLASQDLTVHCSAAATPCNITVIDVPEPSGLHLSFFGLLLLVARRGRSD